MVNLTKSLLDAISIIADKTVDEVSSDKTIKAIVKKVVSTSEGKYLVTYNSGDFYAYVQSGSTNLYQVGEQIYILIPEGDMSQKKFIIGKVKNDDDEVTSKKHVNSLLNDYVMIGTNAVIEKEYRVSPLGDSVNVDRMQPLELNSHSTYDFHYCYIHDPSTINELPEDYDTITNKIIDIDEESFINSAKQAEALLIRANFKASIDTENIGNYGIIVNVAFADRTNPQTDDNNNVIYPPKLVAYVLDTSKMTGNPMKFYDYISQYTISNFDGENYLYIDSIIAFSESFVNEETESHDEYDDIYIYIDGLEIIALNEISAINGDYKLKLTTPRSNTIRAGYRNELEIVAHTTYFDQDISKNTIFYWGIKDPSITSTNNYYNAKFGSGYKYLNNTNTNTLILTHNDLTAAENIFICVAVYESNIILKAFVTLYNNNNNIKITIDSDQGTSFQFNEGNPTLTCLINGRTSNYQKNYPDSAFSFIWSKEDEEFGTVILDKTKKQLEVQKQNELEQCRNNENHLSDTGRSILQILSYYSTQTTQIQNISYPNGVHGSKINCKLKNINNYVTYSCSVYRGDVYVGYGSITLQNSKNVINNNYYVTITNGNQVFQYDESGIAPNSQKNQEPIDVLDLIAVFHNPQGIEVTPKKVRWVMPKGKTLINIPSLGLETDPETGEKYFIGDIYPLNIKETYDNNCNDNQLTVIVTHADGTEYRQSSNLLFTKIGEIGTNGTNIVVKIDELINSPEDECLTIIKSSTGDTFYNSYTSNNELISTDISVLEANLYTNNSQTLGYTTKWTIAGTSEIQSHNYKVEGNNDNSCVINYDGINDELDTRIIRAQTNLNGKYFYGFYGMPAIEYYNGYSYKDYPIKIIKNETLKNILYDSNGTNPSYNGNQGIHIELIDWPETGFLEWEVESGPQTNGVYDNPNLLLAKSPKSKTGSRKLEINSNIDDINTFILTTQDISNIYADEAPVNIKDYINAFVADVEKIGADNILSTSSKLTNLWNRLATFRDEFSDQTNIYIKTVYEKYYELFNRMTEEYDLRREINKKSAEIYNKIQNIWNSEWPNVITKERLSVIDSVNINNIQELVQLYQQAYDDRSNVENDAVQLPTRDIFQNIENGIQFLTLLDNMDTYYDTYRTFLGNEAISLNYILVEYAKILMAYLNIIINETQECFEGTYTYTNAKGQSVNLYNEIKSKYSLAYEDWSIAHNLSTNPASDLASKHIIGKNIYDIIVSAEEISANIYDSIRELYLYYQALYLKIKKYQVAEESETLNSWNAILNGEKIDLLNHIYIIPNDTFNGLYMNNNVVGKVFIKDNDNEIQVAKVYIPIIMTLNTYELAALNGWDGTSIEIGDDHILTPQVGAGIKDDTTNTFTGMVMGAIDNKILDDPSKVNKVGLLGYYNGQQSLFIDSKTGKATFGLPSEDNSTNEGRIELVPGGVSKIGNWKIGNRFLYNIVGGNYEKRADNDSRNNFYKNKWMVPHDKYGIILSADQPYIHIKGETYENTNLTGINYNDEYNNINPGDSLELRMDSNNKSLFSIVQHTAGFGDEDIEDLFFGYRLSSDLKVKNYVANENIENAENQIGDNIKYYIYRLKTGVDGSYQPYYEFEGTQNNLSKSGSWITDIPILSGTKQLSNSLTYFNFKQAFNINAENGMITYNPENLIWENNNDGWESNTERISSTTISPSFRYNKNNNSAITQNVSIGQLRNNSNNDIYQVKFSGCNIFRTLTGINLNSSNNAYVQFYLVSNNNYNIDNDNVLLKSNPINIWNNQSNIVVELFSTGINKYLAKNTTYYLKMYLYVDTYNINSIYSSSQITGTYFSYYSPPSPQYGVIKITNASTGSYSFTTSNGLTQETVSGIYNYSSGNIKFYVYGNNQYDFILWRQQNNNSNNVILGCGRTDFNYQYAKFFTSTATEWNNLSTYKSITAPSSNNPICISFYPLGTYTTENMVSTNTSNSIPGQNTTATQDNSYSVSYTVTSSGSLSNVRETNQSVTLSGSDNINNTVVENTITTIKYKLIDSNVTSVISTNEYDGINWGELNNNYNTAQAIWNFSITTNLNNTSILGSVPNSNVDINTLCVEGSTPNSSIQGIPYAETYWEINNNQITQKIKFYKDYYDWVNNNTNPKTQYGYVDVSNYNDHYYKYIKTLKKNIVNNWFIDGLNDTSFNHSVKISGTNIYSWISLSTKSNNFQDAIYWKEFIRVGLDENGRFFSAGFQDKKTYSRTGRIYSFGKVPNLYGQEIRVQQNNNKYVPILKIFANSSDLNTTYITQNEKDDGNISIRTSKSTNYVELAASQTSDNKTNTIPIKTGYVKVSNNDGVQIQHNNIITLTSEDNIIIESKKTVLQTVNNYANCEFSEPIIKINNQDQVVGQIKLKSDQYHLIVGNNNYSHIFINNNEVTFKVGDNTSTRLFLESNSAQLKIDNNKCIVLNQNNHSYFKVNNMTLNFSTDNIITLQNTNNYIKVQNNKILLNTGTTTNIGLNIDSKVTIQGSGGLLVDDGPLVTNSRARLMNNVYVTNGKFIVGYNDSNQNSVEGVIYLYQDNQKKYLQVYAKHLKQLFDWYNTKRWGIGVAGNTVWLRNIASSNNPEGSYNSSQSRYDWSLTKFEGNYSGTGGSV